MFCDQHTEIHICITHTHANMHTHTHIWTQTHTPTVVGCTHTHTDIGYTHTHTDIGYIHISHMTLVLSWQDYCTNLGGRMLARKIFLNVVSPTLSTSPSPLTTSTTCQQEKKTGFNWQSTTMVISGRAYKISLGSPYMCQTNLVNRKGIFSIMLSLTSNILILQA